MGNLACCFPSLLQVFERGFLQKIFHFDGSLSKSLVSTANDFSTIVRQQRTVSGLSAKIQDSVNAQVFIWTQFL